MIWFVDGTIYDVKFSITTLNTFTDGSKLSVDAASALTSAVNMLLVTELAGIAEKDSYIPNVDNTQFIFDGAFCENTTACSGAWKDGTGSGGSLADNGSVGFAYEEAADFTAIGTVSVPEPLSLGLFGTGLAALFLLRRRSKTLVA